MENNNNNNSHTITTTSTTTSTIETTTTTKEAARTRANRLKIPLPKQFTTTPYLFKQQQQDDNTTPTPLPDLPPPQRQRQLKRKTDAYKHLVLLFRHLSSSSSSLEEKEKEDDNNKNKGSNVVQKKHQRLLHQRILEIFKKFPSLAGRGFPYYHHHHGGGATTGTAVEGVCRYPLFHLMGSPSITIEIIEPIYKMFPDAISQRLPQPHIPSMLHYAIWKKIHPTIIDFLVKEYPASLQIKCPQRGLPIHHAIFQDYLPISTCRAMLQAYNPAASIIDHDDSLIIFTDRLMEYILNYTSNPNEMIRLLIECNLVGGGSTIPGGVLRIWGGESALFNKPSSSSSSSSQRDHNDLLVLETLTQCNASEVQYFLQPWNGKAFAILCDFLKKSKTVQQINFYGEPNPGIEESEFLMQISSNLLKHQTPIRRDIYFKKSSIRFGRRRQHHHHDNSYCNNEGFELSWYTTPAIRIMQRTTTTSAAGSTTTTTKKKHGGATNNNNNNTLELHKSATNLSSLRWVLQLADNLPVAAVPNTTNTTTTTSSSNNHQSTTTSWKLRLHLQRIVSHAPSSTQQLLLRDDWNICKIETLSLKFGLRGGGGLPDETVLRMLWKISDMPNLKCLGLCYLEYRKEENWLNVTDVIVKLIKKGRLLSLNLSSGMKVDMDPLCAALKELDPDRGRPIAYLENFVFDDTGYNEDELIALARHMPKIFTLERVELQMGGGASGADAKDTVDVISYYAALNRFGRVCLVQYSPHHSSEERGVERKFVDLLAKVSSRPKSAFIACHPGKKIKSCAILYGLLRFSPDFWLKPSLMSRERVVQLNAGMDKHKGPRTTP